MNTLQERRQCPDMISHFEELQFLASQAPEFLDITDSVALVVEHSGVRTGLLTVHSLHTTAAVIVNEHEPLLLQDMSRLLEKLAPQHLQYGHDNFKIRTVNRTEDEARNGHAHCKALFLPTSVTLSIRDGALLLGRWQRIFFVELDSPRHRHIAMNVLGTGRGGC